MNVANRVRAQAGNKGQRKRIAAEQIVEIGRGRFTIFTLRPKTIGDQKLKAVVCSYTVGTPNVVLAKQSIAVTIPIDTLGDNVGGASGTVFDLLDCNGVWTFA